jgi:hypothetical protein
VTLQWKVRQRNSKTNERGKIEKGREKQKKKERKKDLNFYR